MDMDMKTTVNISIALCLTILNESKNLIQHKTQNLGPADRNQSVQEQKVLENLGPDQYQKTGDPRISATNQIQIRDRVKIFRFFFYFCAQHISFQGLTNPLVPKISKNSIKKLVKGVR